MTIDDVIAKIHSTPSSLFLGAGSSVPGGGPTWDVLFNSIKARFPAGRSAGFFDYFEEVITPNDSNRPEIEQLVRTLLATIIPTADHRYLLSLPWKAVLTTNYDHIPDLGEKTLDDSRVLVPVLRASDSVDYRRRSDLLYCFKLLGDCQINFPTEGFMVLASRDRRIAYLRQHTFFRLFQQLASSGSIIYVGHSFEDKFVFDLLYDMQTSLGKFPWQGFAITPTQPSADSMKRLMQHNITWTKGTLGELIGAAKARFGDPPVSASVTRGTLVVHGVPLSLDRSTESNLIGRYKYLHQEAMNPLSAAPRAFLSGRDPSFFPYLKGWDFPRKIKATDPPDLKHITSVNTQEFARKRAETGNASDNITIVLHGSAGSGKSIVANRLAFDWYHHGNPVVYVDSNTPFLDLKVLEGLLDEVWRSYQDQQKQRSSGSVPPLRFLIIADDAHPFFPALAQLRDYLKSIGKPSDVLIIERTAEVPWDHISKVDQVWSIDDTVTDDERERFVQHFTSIGAIGAREGLMANLNDPEINSSFFALMFTSIRDSQIPITKMVRDEFQRLNQEGRAIYTVVSLIQSHALKPWVSLVERVAGTELARLEELLGKGNLLGILEWEEGRDALRANHRIVAEIIANAVLETPREFMTSLRAIVGAVTPSSEPEIEFVHNLLTRQVPKSSPIMRLTLDQKMSLFETAISVVRTRPLLHHLAMLQLEAERFDKCRELLNLAKQTRFPRFDEPENMVLDTEGRLNLAEARRAKAKGDPALAMSHVQDAIDVFQIAQEDPLKTPHPFEGLAKSYYEMAKLNSDEDARNYWLILALSTCNFYRGYSGNGEWDISDIEREVLELLPTDFSEARANALYQKTGNVDGFAFLAEKMMGKNDPREAMQIVLEALPLDRKSVWLNRLRVKLLNRMFPGDYAALNRALQEWNAASAGRFDTLLSFALAKATFILGNYPQGDELFRQLYAKTTRHPHRLSPLEEDRWFEGGKPKEFLGVVEVVPRLGEIGKVRCTSPPLSSYANAFDVRFQDLEFAAIEGNKVRFSIIFNMKGPQASRVRRL